MSDLLNQASLVMVPSGYKEDTVYSVVPSDGSGDLSFTRASNGTRINSAGLVEVVPWNLAQYSEDFSNAVWDNNGGAVLVTANATTAPNGTTTADQVENNPSSSNTPWMYQFFTNLIGGQTYTYSVYAKASTSGTKQLAIWNNSTAQTYQNINVTTEWQRFEFSFVANASATQWAIGLEFNGAETAYFIWGAQLNIGSTAKPYFPTTDRLNVPRLTYQNGGGGCPSLLLEKQSTNLASYSEDFTNAAWNKGDVTITSNDIISPDGTQNADKFILDATNSGHIIYQSIPNQNSGYYTISCYVKYGNVRYFATRSQTGGVVAATQFYDLQNGVVVGGSSDASITSVGNGWYRITLKCLSANSTDVQYIVYCFTTSSTSETCTSDGSLYGYIWGAQAENGTYATSLIYTTSASATRVADDYSRSLSSIASGTAYINITDNVAVGTPGTHLFGPFSITGASLGLYLSRPNNARLRLWTQASANVFQTTETNLKLAMTWDGTNVNVYQNGVKVVTNYAYAITNVNNLFSSTYLESSATIAEIVLFNSVLTDAECIALTT